MLIVFVIAVPCAIAVAFGQSGRRDKPTDLRAFLVGAAWAIGWTFGSVVLWQGLWISAMGAQGDRGIMGVAFYWAVMSAPLWFPILMITYVITAQRALKE